MPAAAPWTRLEELSQDLLGRALALASYAEEEAGRRAAQAEAVPFAADHVAAILAARRARADAFGLDLSNPGWSLLLALHAAHLRGRGVPLARLPREAGVPPTTMLRWLDRLGAAGLAERAAAAPKGESAIIIRLTEAGAAAMHRQLTAFRTAWTQR
jgi:DNA-binding MarR family transcriptional regulator